MAANQATKKNDKANAQSHSPTISTTEDEVSGTVERVQEFNDPNEPVYLLSLDGGGIRGISEAVILHEIMERVKVEKGLKDLPPPCDYFHLIGGTSTGGLISIMLGRLGMTTQQVLDEYEKIAENIFHKKNRRLDKTFGEDKLEKAVKQVVDKRGMGAEMSSSESKSNKGSCFVVTLQKGQKVPTLFRSYKTKEEPNTTCEIWEAARATTAAPGFFPPAKVKSGGKDAWFVDAAIMWNNPTRIVLAEASSHLGGHRRLGCLLSLGTGVPAAVMAGPEPKKRRFGINYNVSEMLTLTTLITNPEPPHEETQAQLKNHPGAYFRFSLPCQEGQEKIRIHEYRKMRALRKATEEYISRPEISEILDEVVDVLCRKSASDLTLHDTCHAASPEAALMNVTHPLQDRERTSPVFTGREDILNHLLEETFSPRTPETNTTRRDFWLWGEGGVGKTQIALRFMDLARHRFDRMFWIDASDATTIYRSFQDIDTQLSLGSTGSTAIRAVLQWLESAKGEWLLVVDNYNNGDMSNYLPIRGGGNVLFTSRRFDLNPVPPRKSKYNVTEMDMSDSVRLLLRACRLDEHSERLQERAIPLVEELGSLPLALNSAGSNIHATDTTFEDYILMLQHQKNDLSKNPTDDSADDEDSVAGNLSVYATFELSLKSIKSFARGSSERAAACQSALQILNTFCFYHSQSIPSEIFARANTIIKSKKGWDKMGLFPVQQGNRDMSNMMWGIGRGNDSGHLIELLKGGLNTLIFFSLLKLQSAEGALYAIHPLIHSWLRKRMYPGSYERNYRISRILLYYSFDPSFHNADAERFYPLLLPHMVANNSYCPGIHETLPFMMRNELDWMYTMILKRCRLWEEAVPLFESAVKAWVYELRRDDWVALNAMLELGRAYMAVGRVNDAEGLFHEVHERTEYCSNPRRAWEYAIYARRELSMVYLLQGEFGEASYMALRCRETARDNSFAVLGPEVQLCLTYQYWLRWEDAERWSKWNLERRMQLRQQGEHHHETWKNQAELARIRAHMGKVDEAEETLAEVAGKFVSDVGEDHYDTLVAKSDLAWVYFVQNRFEEAEPMQRQLLAAGRARLGSTHLYTLYMMLRLGVTLGEMGKWHEAIHLLKECMDGRDKVIGWGKSHPAVSGILGYISRYQLKLEGRCMEELATKEELEMLARVRSYADHPYSYVQIRWISLGTKDGEKRHFPAKIARA